MRTAGLLPGVAGVLGSDSLSLVRYGCLFAADHINIQLPFGQARIVGTPFTWQGICLAAHVRVLATRGNIEAHVLRVMVVYRLGELP